MLDYNQLEALAVVVEEGGFEKAGETLHITQSAVSQRIRQMEELTGQILLIRSQPPELTEQGLTLIKHFKKVRLLENELASKATDTGFLPLIPLAVNADSLATWFSDVIGAYMQRRRGFLEIRSADQDITHRLLASGEVMGSISASASPVRACKSVYLGDMVYRLVCNEDYQKKYFPGGMSIEALLQAPLMNFDRDDQLLKSWIEQFITEGRNLADCHYIPSTDLFLLMINRGEVCGMIPEEQYLANKVDKKLVDLSLGKPVLVPLYWHRWAIESTELDHLSRLIRHFAEKVLH